jgi:hypothetical protein
MEGKRVDGPYVVDVVDRLAVAFEGVFVFWRCGAWVEVFDFDSSLGGACCATYVMRASVNIHENK